MNFAKEGMFLDHADPRAGMPREAPGYRELPDSMRKAVRFLFDYAGFAPPANTEPQEVISNFGRYSKGNHRLMLNYLVQRALYVDSATGEKKSDFDVLDSTPNLSRMLEDYEDYSALITVDPLEDPEMFKDSITRIEQSNSPENILAIELPVNTVDSVRHIVGGGLSVFEGKEIFFEVSNGADMSGILDEIAQSREKASRTYAKLRTGGIKPPSFKEISEFMIQCAQRGIPYKLTGRLHGLLAHTNKTDGVKETGYLNAVLASELALGVAEGLHEMSDVLEMLKEEDIDAFEMTKEAIKWRGKVFPAATIRGDISKGLHSIGTCSFDEPVQELARLRPAA